MHIVFIVGSYFPSYSAVGKCVGNIADMLAKTNQVTVICLKGSNNEDDFEIYNGQNIIRINTAENQIINKLNNNIRVKEGLQKTLYKSIIYLDKLSRFIKIILSRVTVKNELVNEYFEALKKISSPIDLIVPSSMPFESVIAAVDFKKYSKAGIKVIPYLFDQFADNSNLHRLKINKLLKRSRHIELEKEIILHSDSILAMHSLKTHFENCCGEYAKKINYVEHPLIINPIIRPFHKSNNGIQISYIGGLYKNYVTPDYLLKLFANLKSQDLFLNFYIIGNCSGTVDRYCSRFPKVNIINHGSVIKEEANKAAATSDILVSIAEIDGIQMSSKIFEYMSLGKPIIHFYSAENDVNLKILKKYPICLCIKQDIESLDKNTKLFIDFCNKYKDSYADFNYIKNVFKDASPEFTAKLMLNLAQKE